jgi:hypothetical protein
VRDVRATRFELVEVADAGTARRLHFPGSPTIRVEGRDVELRPGDRIDLPAGVEHAATVGPDGVECLEGTS